MGYFRFFSALYPSLKKKNLTRNPLNYYSLKVTKFHRESVKNESARTKNYKGERERVKAAKAGCTLNNKHSYRRMGQCTKLIISLY